MEVSKCVRNDKNKTDRHWILYNSIHTENLWDVWKRKWGGNIENLSKETFSIKSIIVGKEKVLPV